MPRHDHDGTGFAARPRSASHTSPGWGLIELVYNLLLDHARAHHVKSIVVSCIDHLRYERAHLLRDFRFPLAQLRVQLFRDGVHGSVLLPPVWLCNAQLKLAFIADYIVL